MALCTGASTCRGCQLWGALAFDEPMPDLTRAAQHSSPAAAAAAQDEDRTPPEAAVAAQDDDRTPPAAAAAAAAAEPVTMFRHPKALVGWPPVAVPDFPDRRNDPEFRAAARKVKKPLRPGAVEFHRAEQFQKCKYYTEFSDGIDFRFWSATCDFDSLWKPLMFLALQPWTLKLYIGVTSDLRWRWADCWRSSTEQRPHNDQFTNMYPMSVADGDTACAMEELLQAKFLAAVPSRCPHTSGYRRGPVKPNALTFIYFCVKYV